MLAGRHLHGVFTALAVSNASDDDSENDDARPKHAREAESDRRWSAPGVRSGH